MNEDKLQQAIADFNKKPKREPMVVQYPKPEKVAKAIVTIAELRHQYLIQLTKEKKEIK